MSTPRRGSDPELSRRLAEALATFPDVAGLSVAFLGAGTDHVAFDVGERFVFRVPRTPEAGASAECERRLTAMLAPQLPIAIPHFRFVGGSSADIPFGFSGYERLPGSPGIALGTEPPAWREVAGALGAFLRILHRVDVASAIAVGVPPDDDPALEAWSAQAIEDVTGALRAEAIDAKTSASSSSFFSRPPSATYEPTLVHGDLAAEHVLLGLDGRVSGIIDWSDAMIGDRALDLAGLLHWGGDEMLSAALATYGTCDADTLTRARWFAGCRAVADIVFGIEEERAEYVAAGQRALVHIGLHALGA